MSGIKLWSCFIFSKWQRHMKPFHCCFQWCFVHFNIAERMMSLLQCMLITIHRQEKCMFSCLLFTREGVAIFKKRGFVINFIWMAPQKISYFNWFHLTFSSDVSPPEDNKVDRVCDAIRAKLELAGHNKYVQHLVLFFGRSLFLVLTWAEQAWQRTSPSTVMTFGFIPLFVHSLVFSQLLQGFYSDFPLS